MMVGRLLAGKNQEICSVRVGLFPLLALLPSQELPEARGALGRGNVLTSEVHARLSPPLPLLLPQVAVSSVHLCPLWGTVGGSMSDCHAPGCQLTVVRVQLLLWPVVI